MFDQSVLWFCDLGKISRESLFYLVPRRWNFIEGAGLLTILPSEGNIRSISDLKPMFSDSDSAAVVAASNHWPVEKVAQDTAMLHYMWVGC